jgi:uncharacterized C2H2 Zn-finger protein
MRLLLQCSQRPALTRCRPSLRPSLPTPYLELGSIAQIHNQTPLIALPRRLKQTHLPLIDLDHRTAPRIAHALLHPAPIRHDDVHRLLQIGLNKRLKPLHPVRNRGYIGQRGVVHELLRREVAQPRHRDAEQVRFIRKRRGRELIRVPRCGELVRVDVHADAKRDVAQVAQWPGEEGGVW